MKTAATLGMQVSLALVVTAAGVCSISSIDVVVRSFEDAGLGASLRLLFGSIEIVAGVCLLTPRSAKFATVALMCLSAGMGGVIASQAIQGHVIPVSWQIAWPRVHHLIEQDRSGDNAPPWRSLGSSTARNI